ncbi:MAG: 16S rRNA (adenine(1518)-N(6)/adenine(1519)-N(6))-dimethyltransferase RsmA, partial [Candidatus Omnitrophica bacterium]|nr:16S rRNA (adenine(1518)-N(6)/adenine(1519)-N(6))-dimethyltransferase RsmA [Candidatus Omnitrophota bacterium]
MPTTLSMLTKTELKSVFEEYGFAPLKRFGENYLIDKNIKDKIIREAGISKSDTILEIGPGLGALTMDLSGSGAEVFAVEKDPKAFRILEELVFEKYPNLHLFNDDILKFDLKKTVNSKEIKVLGNLPYYVTTPIIEYVIKNGSIINSALVVIQKEVAGRLSAEPGSKDYSSISCFVQYFMKPEYLYTIKRASFYPVPEVDSSLIRLSMRAEPKVTVRDEKLFFKIIRGSFNQRRKSI